MLGNDPRRLMNAPEETMRIALDGRQASIWTAMPGIITAVDFNENTCTVQPAIQGQVQDENGDSVFVDLPLLIHVPIVFPRAGGFALTFPLGAGDEVLVIFSSRCIDSWWQLGGVQRPIELRLHDISDGFAIPGPCSQPKKLSNISTTDAQLRSVDGNTYIGITPSGDIKLKAVNIEIEGDVTVDGDISADEVYASTTPLHTHVHGGVTTGGGSTGGPVP